jgi:hypothetical protein
MHHHQRLASLRNEWSARHDAKRARAFFSGIVSESDMALLSEIVDAIDAVSEAENNASHSIVAAVGDQ